MAHLPVSYPTDLNNPDTRRLVLLERLADTGRLVASELVDSLGVSGDTIRRDLLALEQEGQLRRVRGGALPINMPTRPFHERSSEVSDATLAIAARAATWPKPGSALLVDGGTSAVAFARQLRSDQNLTIITPSPAVAMAAMDSARELILIGGRLSPFGAVAVGAGAESEIRRCAVDLAVLGACSINVDQGLGADDHDEASMKRAMISAAEQSMVLATTDKFAHRSRFCVAALDRVSCLVTDAAPESLQGTVPASMEIVHVQR